MKKSKSIITFVVIVVCLGLLCWFGENVITDTLTKQKANMDSSYEPQESEIDNAITLGLDLSGGVSITYKIVDEDYTNQELEDTKAKLEARAASYTTEYSVYASESEGRITVEIPGVDDPEAVLEDLGSPGSLYFIAHYDSDGNENYSGSSYYGYTLNYSIEELEEKGSIILTGNDVKAADAGYETDNLGSENPVVQLTLNDDAIDTWYEATTEAYNNNEDSIAIYYDGQFVSVPSVSAAINDGNCVINGMSDYETAEQLATYIRIGAIDLELEELESSIVGASLGDSAIRSALIAAGIGLILVMIFMIVMYGISGVAADIALACYTAIVVAFIQLFEVTLTLPGIAGVILGIGMAVDANVINFARIREEIASGKPVLASIKEGYKKAFSAILDGNVTTFIAALVLLILGSGTVRGFAYTLMISIVASMFTALVVTRLLMLAFYGLGVQSEKAYGRAKDRKPLNFIKHRVVYFAVSLCLILAGVVGMIAYSASGKKALNYGIEFAGGTSTTVDLGQAYTVDELEAEVVPYVQEITGGTVQATTVNDSTSVVFKTNTLDQEQREELTSMFEEQFGVDEDSIESQSISSTISSEMRSKAILAVAIACVFMLLYIWLRFKDLRFASSAILALVHDVLVVLTSYALIRISVGNTFIACMLTIVGYSVNDTIVIFDRIRENMKGQSHLTRAGLADVANKSLTQTLSRSINTSITTIIMVLALYITGGIMGVTSMQEFALPLLVGMICGSYSSIFIATQLWYIMKCHFGKHKIKE